MTLYSVQIPVHPINKLKKNCMISIDPEKAFGKSQHTFVIKAIYEEDLTASAKCPQLASYVT